MTAKKAILAMFAGAMLGTPVMHDIAASAASGEVPDRILLMPFGDNELGDGRGTIHLRDRAHAEAVVAATRKSLGKREFMFDYDHEAMKVADEKVMGQAIAAGWAKDFEIDADGIWATQIKWTPAGEAKIAAGEYRYISPWFFASKKTGDLTRFINAALVNRPAFNLEAIAASLNDQNSQLETEDMDLKAIAAALGLAEDADETAILAAIATQSATQTAVAAALNANEGDDLAAVAAGFVATAAKAGAPDPKEFVPMAAFQQLQTSVTALTKDRNEAIVGAAIRDGKITPAQKAWAASFLDKHGETEFDTFIASQPKIIADRVVPQGEPGGEHGLSAEQVSLCASMGWDTKAYAATLKEEGEA